MAPRNQSIKVLEPTRKATSIGRGLLKKSSMNKHKRRSFKKYRGQGKAR